MGLTLNYNNYHVSGTGGVLGLFNTADRTTFASWQTATGQEPHGKNADPLFENATAPTPNLHLTGLNNPCDGTGLPIAAIIDDFEGDIRTDQTPTDLGADAGNHGFTSTDIGVIGVARPTRLTTCHSANEPVVVTLRNFSSVPLNLAISPVTLQTIVSGGTSVTFTTRVDTGILAAGATRAVTMGNLNTNNVDSFAFTTTATHADDINNTNNNNITSVQIGIPPMLAGNLRLTGRGGYHCIGMNHNSNIHTMVTGGVLPYTYLWSTGDTTPHLVQLTPAVTTHYQVTITDACGTSLIKDTTIQLAPCLYAPTWTENTSYHSIIATGSTYTSLAGIRQEISAFTNTVSLAGTTFQYQGEPVTAFYANEDGFLSFNTTSPVSNGQIGYLNTVPTRMLAPYYSNLALKNNSIANKDTSMRYKIVGTLGSGTADIVIEWAQMEIEGSTSADLNFQVVLHERDNTIDFNYGRMLRYNGTQNSLASRNVGIGLSGKEPERNSFEQRMILQQLNTHYMGTEVAPFLNGTPKSNAQLKFTPVASYMPPIIPIPVLSNDEPNRAIEIPIHPIPCTMENESYYSSKTATLSTGIPTCGATAGVADDDVWFQFTTAPTITAHKIRVNPSYEYDAVVQLLDSALMPIQCANANGAGIAETIEFTLIPNRRYYLRVYDAAIGASASGEFSICVSTPSVTSTPTCVNSNIAPANGSTICNAPILTWTSATNASHYDVYLNAGTNAPTTLMVANLTDTTYRPTGLTTGRYTWKVVPKNANGAAMGCNSWTFDWVSPTINAIHGNRCGNGTVNLGASATNGMIVKWYDAMTGGNLLGTGTLFSTPFLVANTTYYAVAAPAINESCAVPRVAVTATVHAIDLTLNTTNTSICAGNWSDTIRITSPIGRFDSYTWSPANFLAQGDGTVRFNPIQTSTYNLTAANRVSGCTNSVQITVQVKERPTAAITGANIICTGSSTLLTASGGNRYLWSTGATTPSISASIAGIYKVTVTNASGCVDSSMVTVTANARPTAAIANNRPTTFCAGDSSVLTASGVGTYLWSTGATSAAITARTSGTYKVTVTSGAGCTDSAMVSITANARPTAAIANSRPTTFCAGDSTVLTARGGTTYRWTTPTGATTDSVTTAKVAGVYKILVFNALGCSDSANITITVNPKPTVAFTSTSLGGNATFTNTSTGGNTYSWSFGDTSIVATTLNTTRKYWANGTYTVKLVVISAAGCRDSITNSIVITRVANEEILAGLKARVYPNPTARNLHIEFQTTTIQFGTKDYISVTDAFGREVYRQAIGGNFVELNTENWALGLYMINAVISNQKVGLSKVVKIDK